MYIQEKDEGRSNLAPPDYSGHTYQAAERAEEAREPAQAVSPREEKEVAPEEVPAGVFSGGERAAFLQKDGKRGGIFEGLGPGGLFSRTPFLSSLLPPPRKGGEGERRRGEWWDIALLAVAVLFLLQGRENDVLPILLLLLLWD